MSISSLVLHAKPERLASVRRRLEDDPAVEIHAETKDGRLVVTVDEADDARAAQIIAELPDMEGVISASLIYNHFEQQTEKKGGDR